MKIHRILNNGCFLLAALLVVSLLVGCSSDTHIKQAEQAIRQAQGAHADYLAPYEFHSAELYLAESLKQLHESDFDAASTFAMKAKAQAQAAEQKSRTIQAEPMVPWSEEMQSETPPPPPIPEAVGPKPGVVPAETKTEPPKKNVTDEYPLGEPEDEPSSEQGDE